MPGCSVDKMRLSAFADGEVAAEEREALEAHAAECPRCRAYLDGLSALTARMAGSACPAVAEEQWEAMWGRIEAHLSAAHSVPGRPVLVRLWRFPRRALLAAAVVLGLVTAAFLIRGLGGRTPIEGANNFGVARRGEVQVESFAYNSDEYTLVIRAPQGGQGPVVWLAPSREQ